MKYNPHRIGSSSIAKNIFRFLFFISANRFPIIIFADNFERHECHCIDICDMAKRVHSRVSRLNFLCPCQWIWLGVFLTRCTERHEKQFDQSFCCCFMPKTRTHSSSFLLQRTIRTHGWKIGQRTCMIKNQNENKSNMRTFSDVMQASSILSKLIIHATCWKRFCLKQTLCEYKHTFKHK